MDRIGVDFVPQIMGVSFLSQKHGASVTFPKIGVSFRLDAMIPEKMTLGNSDGTIGYSDDDYGFIGLERT